MADDRYRDSWRGRGRGGSIFSDDDGGWRGERSGGRDWNPEEYGWGSRPERGGEGGGRGLFDRAKDEVRSWFGEDDERGRGGRGSYERSRYGQGQSGFGGESYRSNRSSGGEGGGYGGGYSRRDQAGTSHFDENYRRWRDQQIARLDQEYEDYCRERQQRFETDFDSWRQSRQSAGESGRDFGSESGAPGDSARKGGIASSRSALLGDESAGATTAGGGDASAMESSTGSSPESGTEAGGRGRG